MAEAREQQAALAVLAQGKRNIGSVENRHVLEAHGYVARDSLLDVGVEADRGCLQHPVLVADRAAGVAHLGQGDLAVREHIELLRVTAAVAIHQLKVRLVEIRGAVDVVTARVAAHAQFRVLEINASLDGDAASLFVVSDRVRSHAARVLPHFDAAVQNGIAVGVEQGIVAFDVDPVIVGGNVGSERDLILRRCGAQVRGIDHGGAREAENNGCGSSMKRRGQIESP